MAFPPLRVTVSLVKLSQQIFCSEQSLCGQPKIDRTELESRAWVEREREREREIHFIWSSRKIVCESCGYRSELIVLCFAPLLPQWVGDRTCVCFRKLAPVATAGQIIHQGDYWKAGSIINQSCWFCPQFLLKGTQMCGGCSNHSENSILY